jgi:hypothetical protein
MSLAIKIPDTLEKVKDALNVWAAWMERDNTKSQLGYPRASTGFRTGGGDWGYWVQDNEYASDLAIARAVDAILEDMDLRLQHAVFHFHIAAVITPRRTKIEDDYAEAVGVIEIGLNRRGLL